MPVIDEIAAYLVAQGLGTYGANIIAGARGEVPTGDGPYLSLTETGGTAPTRVQNKAGASTTRPTVQIAVRAKSYAVARAKCKAAYDALDGLFNATLSGTFYQKITARQEPTGIGLDGKGRPVIVFNVEVEKDPS